MARRAARLTVAILAALAALLVAAELRGRSGRTFLPSPGTRTVSGADDAFRAWKAAGLRGRALLLFAPYPHHHTSYAQYAGGAPLTPASFLEFAVFEDVVRRVWLVVPDERWEAFRRDRALYRPFREDPGGQAMYLHGASGVPVVATPAAALPHLDEEVLVLVDGARFDPAAVDALLARKGIRHDLEVVLDAGGRP